MPTYLGTYQPTYITYTGLPAACLGTSQILHTVPARTSTLAA